MTAADTGRSTLESPPDTVAAQANPDSPDQPQNASTNRRPMRADARRNYDKILATARVVFTERGTDASLDEIAKRAEVGPGTLYRHFPTREALVDALMQDWTDRVAADADAAIATGAPAPAMLLRLVRALRRAHHPPPGCRHEDLRGHGRPRVADVPQVPRHG